MAEKIAALNLGLLTNNEAYGFLNDVVHQIQDTFTTQPDFIVPFITAQKAFDAALKGTESALTATDLANADHDTDLAWCGLNAYLKAMVVHPTEEKRLAAQKVSQVFSQYDNPTALAYATEYGIMERLLADLKAIPAATLNLSGTAEWIDALSEKCSTFIQLYSIRIQDNATKVTGATKTARLNALSAYREMVKMTNALLIVSPNDELSRFAAHLNELISAKQTAIKTKKTKSANNASEPSLNLIDNPDGTVAGVIE